MSLDLLRAMARNNATSNHRLHAACARLDDEAFRAPRTSFFPSIHQTLNHILTVDWYYLDALEDGGRGLSVFEPELPFDTLEPLAAAQAETDRRLVTFCDALDEQGLARLTRIERGHAAHREPVRAVLPHLFVHQIHHRGQVHAMLTGTDVPPPQLDEFFLVNEGHLRAADLAAVGIRDL
jgi:uncharacterized damage-inducible protein DinB